MRIGKTWVYASVVAIFFAYTAWMVAPYLQSVIVRDAAVTTWSNVATAPIDGEVEIRSSARQVGAGGLVVHVHNEHLSRRALNEAELRVRFARTRVDELSDFLAEVRLLDTGRGDLKAQYAETFRDQLDAEIVNLQRRLGVTAVRRDVMARVAARSEQLARRGTGSETAADEARLRVADLDLELAELKAMLDDARVRRTAADDGVFITAAGEDPEWVRGWRLELKLEKNAARLQLRDAEAELEMAKAARDAAYEEYRSLGNAVVQIPAGRILWSQPVASGVTVRAGDPLIEWVDCSLLMVDVPVADAEVPLIEPGMTAEVVLEGDAEARRASVLLTRGSASPLGRDDLAAIAKGRRGGVAQVLLELPHEPGEFDQCPVGRAAYVQFPQVGLIDVLRARLRL